MPVHEVFFTTQPISLYSEDTIFISHTRGIKIQGAKHIYKIKKGISKQVQKLNRANYFNLYGGQGPLPLSMWGPGRPSNPPLILKHPILELMRTYPVPEELPPLLLDEPELELDLLLVKLIQLLVMTAIFCSFYTKQKSKQILK